MRPSPPSGTRRLVDDTAVRVLLWALTRPVLFFCWRELEPMVAFRPVDAVVVGGATSRVVLTTEHSSHELYTPWIFYRYEVRGTPHMGKQDRRTDLFRSPSAAYQTATSIPKGTRIRAWYNPFRPDEAVLSREPNCMFLLPWALGLGFIWLYALRRQ